MKDHILLALLFSQKKNSVHLRKNVNEDLAGYISEWHESVNHHGINSLVFHDGLPEDFVNEHTTENVKFRKVDSTQYNTCDARWVVYDEFMRGEGKDYKHVFANDISDVIIGKSPFSGELENYGSDVLFSGEDDHRYSSKWILDRNEQIKESLPEVYSHIVDNSKLKLYNPGIIGGSTEIFQEYCAYMADLVVKGGPVPKTVDMSYHNYVVRTYFNNRVVAGEPVNSLYRKFQKDRKDVWFIHK